MKKRIAAIMLAMTCMLSACQTGETSNNNANNEENETQAQTTEESEALPDNTAMGELPTLRIGVMYSADIIPLAVMQEQELDREEGFILDMQVFSSAKDRDAALQAGELDGVFTDYIGVCMYQNAGMDIKITGCTDGDYQLVVGADAASLADCAGKSIAISENTLIEYTLDYLLTQNGYDTSYLEKVVVPKIPERVEMLSAGQVDMGLLPEPFATVAKNDGAILLGSANESGLYPAVSGFLQSSIDEKSEMITAYYTAYDKAVSYVNETDVAKLEDIIIEKAGFPESLRNSIVLPEYRKNELPDEEDLQKAIDWAIGKGLCDTTITPEKLLGQLQ